MKVIIAGSRDLDDPELVLKAIERSGFDITEVVSGHCPTGVDMLGEVWAKVNQVPVKLFPADWRIYGLAAGPIRNREMADYADALIAIWDGKSPGTKGMIGLALKRKLEVFIYEG